MRGVSSSKCQPRLAAGLHRISSRRDGQLCSNRNPQFDAPIRRLYSLDDPSNKRRRNFSSSGDNPDKKLTGLAAFADREKSSRKVIIGRTPRSQKSKNRTQLESKEAGGSDRLINHIINGGTPDDPAPPPFQRADYGEESLYTLVLLRHGESEWNKLNQYTGWVDVNLTEKGKTEARDAGRLLHENGIEIDHAFTSVLKRASFSCNMALNTAKQHWVPVTKSWRLNERHYGALQGYHKDTAFKELDIDQELVMQMRRSYDVRPPEMQDDHAYWHGNDRRCDD
jgi:hypothetical protein